MGFEDERIAKLMKKKRQKQQQQEQEQAKQTEPVVDEEELIEGIQTGAYLVLDKTIAFQKQLVLEHIVVYLPGTGYEISDQGKQGFQMLDEKEAVSFQFLASQDKEVKTFGEYKEIIQRELKPTGIQFKWMGEGSFYQPDMQIYYMDYMCITGLGTICNRHLFLLTPKGLVIGVLNYEYKQQKYYEPIVKAVTKLLAWKEDETHA